MKKAKQHEIRLLAMQMLYQFDLRGEEDAQAIRSGMDDETELKKKNEDAFELATAAWSHRHESDALICDIAPHWPTRRQPPVDRAILRLACYELATNRVPRGVAINEAVVLAKQFCNEQSPGFINGVLDKLDRRQTSRESTKPNENHSATC